jgi:5'-nucleotidase
VTGGVRALVTNDDGIDSEGLHWLAATVRDYGLDLVVAAPIRESSGQGAGIGGREEGGRIIVQERHLPDLRGVPTYAVAASPALITLIATHGAFGPPPQVVFSGINRGANIGRAVLHSGTVGAALTANAYGCRALAVSLDVRLEPNGDPHWEAAAEYTAQLLDHVVHGPDTVAINLNVPDLPKAEVRGIRQGRLATFGAVQTNLIERGRGFVRLTLADSEAKTEPGTDASWLADGYASVTALQNISEAEAITLALT